MIELPVVAEARLKARDDLEMIRTLAPVTDFFGIGEEIWRADDPVAQLTAFRDAFG